MTANPHSPEVLAPLLPGQQPADRPDIVARVFHLKLAEMHKDVYKRSRLGRNLSNVDTIEFQKRGNPHDHSVLINNRKSTPQTPDKIDLAVSATLPDPETLPDLYALVTQFMLHGPCHAGKSCWSGTKCKYGYPREYLETTVVSENAYSAYRRPDNGKFFLENGYKYTNRDVVPYTRFLLLKFRCHINCEVTAGMKSVKYLYKYISKGHDRRVVKLEAENKPDDFIDGRELAAAEAVWRLYKFVLSGRWPSVTRLALHLENTHTVYFNNTEELVNAIDSGRAARTTLTEFFLLCAANATLPKSKASVQSLLYAEMTEHYWWLKEEKQWVPRANNTVSISRLHVVGLSHGKRYYLRLLLTHVQGPVSFRGIRTINRQVYKSYCAAADAIGLLMSDTHIDACLTEASRFKTGRQLRELLGLILVHSPPANPTKIWNNHIEELSDDCEYMLALLSPSITPTVEQLNNYALSLVKNVVSHMGKTLEDVGLDPVEPNLLSAIGGPTRYNDESGTSRQSSQNYLDQNTPKMTMEKQAIFQHVKERIDDPDGGLLFVDGPGGCGKTFLLNSCLHYCNANAIPFLAVASSGIASLLLLNGGTAHSKLGIPLKPNETSPCSFTGTDPVGLMLMRAKFMVWDEISMMNKTAVECVDCSLRDLHSSDEPFGGIVTLFSGDFRQILPVVVHGSLLDAVRASIKCSYIWKSIQKFRLTKNLRLRDVESHQGADREGFAAWLLKLGSGSLQQEPFALIDLEHVNVKYYKPSHQFDKVLMLKFYSEANPLIAKRDWARLSLYYSTWAIITPLNQTVDLMNQFMLGKMKTPAKLYKSVDEMDLDWAEQVSTKVLNTFNFAGFPAHKIDLKVGAVVVVLRNLNLQQGLSNGTRLLITEACDNVLQCQIITGPRAGNHLSLPRMRLHHPGSKNVPISFYRLKFPVVLAYAMTINKVQGQTLKTVCVALPTPVFAHGQLYVGLSRCTSAKNTTLSLPGQKQDGQTTNVVTHQAMRSTGCV